MARRRTDLSLSQRVEIVQLLDTKKFSQVDLSKRFQCSQSTIYKISTNKEAILREAEANVMSSKKRKRSGKDDEVDAALYTWFVDARARDAPITSAVLEEKANHFGVLLNKPEFRSTNGRLCRWKTRHGIKFKKAHGERKDADVSGAELWSSTVLPELLEKYSPCNIYNADETGIYYRAVPDGTLAFSTDKLSSSKKAKERVTALVACNMDGTDKRPLLVIGKSKEPRCFRGLPHLPTQYMNSGNAWMTGALFRKWLADFNRVMARANRHIVLLVDNCTAHPRDACDDLSHITLVFFPPNVTSVIQPCDMGIIWNLKALYRKNVISRIITHIDAGSSVTVSQLAKEITLLDAMHMLKAAWQNVKQVSIVNCFGFVTQTTPVQDEVDDPPPGMTTTEFCAYVDMDVSLSCHGQLSDDEICNSVRETADPETQCCESDEESEPASMSVSCPKACDAIQAMHTMRKFMDSAGADLCYFYKVESQVLQVAALNTSQTSIRDFFSLSSPEY